MENLKIPEGYQCVMPYLIVKDAAKFIIFMQNVFDAKEAHRSMRDEKLIQHAEVKVGGSTIMFADSTAQYPPQGAGMFIYVADADEAYKKALSNGATAVTKMSDQNYGRTGGVADPFGNVWWITSVN